MHTLNIQLSEVAYTALARAAAESGRTLESVASDQLEVDFNEALGAGFFSPAVLREIDLAREEATRGETYSLEQVRKMRLEKSNAWRESNQA